MQRVALIAALVCPGLFAQPGAGGSDLSAIARAAPAPAGWSLANVAAANAEFVHAIGSGNPDRLLDARIDISLRQLSGGELASAALAQFASEKGPKATLKSLRGWPAVTWSFVAAPPRAGEPADAAAAPALGTYVRTAAVVGHSVVTFSAAFVPTPSARVAADAEAIVEAIVDGAGASLPHPSPQDVKSTLAEVRANLLRPKPSPATFPPARTSAVAAGAAPQPQLIYNGPGELQIAVSDDGQNVLIAGNAGLFASVDGGQTFSKTTPAACPNNHCVGDPSVGVAASGKFYYSWMPFGSSDSSGSGPDSRVSVAISVADPRTLRYKNDAATCKGGVCDQPQLAADRYHAAPSGDRVYVVFRNFKDKTETLPPTPTITCSADGAQTWLPVRQVFDSSADFPRVTVAPDGKVYVIFVAGQAIKLAKYSSCDAGLQMQDGFPVNVSTFAEPVCPIPGLDRCNTGNDLGSPTVAVDETNPNHVYAAWASSTSAGKNEDTLVADSMDGGKTFTRTIKANGAAAGRRFMPWIVVDGPAVYVNWYDRRTSTRQNNDLTRYYGAVITVENGALVARESDISKTDEPQCANLWPAPPRSDADSRSCSLQPEAAGRCHGTDIACDFKKFCAGGRQCEAGDGVPKFGDYNGLAGRNGRRY